jgi:hypothetical protein
MGTIWRPGRRIVQEQAFQPHAFPVKNTYRGRRSSLNLVSCPPAKTRLSSPVYFRGKLAAKKHETSEEIFGFTGLHYQTKILTHFHYILCLSLKNIVENLNNLCISYAYAHLMHIYREGLIH